MNDNMRYLLTSYLKELKVLYRNEQYRAAQLSGYENERMKLAYTKNSNEYYAVLSHSSGKYKYIGTGKSAEVKKIKEAHYLDRSLDNLRREIGLLERLLNKSHGTSYQDINGSLPKVYRMSGPMDYLPGSDSASQWKSQMENYKTTFTPFRPNELIHKTHDNNYVRSLGEALIYNYLLELGITFVYELPLKISLGHKDGLLLPDFTILSEIDYKRIIYIEHQGMMNDPRYRNKFNDTVFKYWSNNYLPERDVFFTFTLPNGGFDDTPIRNILRNCIRPSLA